MTPLWARSTTNAHLAAQYCLVEYATDGSRCAEYFVAPDDAIALDRALDVALGPTAELWRGGELIRRWEIDPSTASFS